MVKAGYYNDHTGATHHVAIVAELPHSYVVKSILFDEKLDRQIFTVLKENLMGIKEWMPRSEVEYLSNPENIPQG